MHIFCNHTVWTMLQVVFKSFVITQPWVWMTWALDWYGLVNRHRMSIQNALMLIYPFFFPWIKIRCWIHIQLVPLQEKHGKIRLWRLSVVESVQCEHTRPSWWWKGPYKASMGIISLIYFVHYYVDDCHWNLTSFPIPLAIPKRPMYIIILDSFNHQAFTTLRASPHIGLTPNINAKWC